MSVIQWLIFIDLVVSGAILFVRGVAGLSRQYTMFDAIFGVAELAAIAWWVALQ